MSQNMISTERDAGANNTTKGAKISRSTKEVRVWNSSIHSEYVFDFTMEEVWPHFINYKSWMDTFSFETLNDEPNSVGELVKTTAKGEWSMVDKITGAPIPNYHYAETIVVVPPAYYTVKVFAEKGGSYGVDDYVGFDNFTLVKESEGRTLAIIAANSEYKSSKHSDDDIAMMKEKASCEVDKKLSRYWENLRNMVENGSCK